METNRTPVSEFSVTRIHIPETGHSRSKGTCPRSEGDVQKGNVFRRTDYSVYNQRLRKLTKDGFEPFSARFSKEGETFGGFQQARNSQE